jgi:hypothetical protein
MVVLRSRWICTYLESETKFGWRTGGEDADWVAAQCRSGHWSHLLLPLGWTSWWTPVCKNRQLQASYDAQSSPLALVWTCPFIGEVLLHELLVCQDGAKSLTLQSQALPKELLTLCFLYRKDSVNEHKLNLHTIVYLFSWESVPSVSSWGSHSSLSQNHSTFVFLYW